MSTTVQPSRTGARTGVLRRRGFGARATTEPITEIWRSSPGAIWRAFLRQSPSFWFLCLYLIIEYVRPQQIYPWFNFMPWGKVSLIGTIVLFFIEGRLPVARSPANWLMLAYTAVVVASSFMGVSPSVSWDKFYEWYYWLIIYFLIINLIDTEEKFFLFLLVYFVTNLKMSQSGFRSWAMDGFHFRDWGIAGAPGWFANSGELGVEMCVFFPMSLYCFLALWKRMKRPVALIYLFMPVSAALVILGTSSRGAQLGMAASIIWMLLKSKYKFRALISAAVFVPLLYFMLPESQLTRFRDAGDDETSVARLTLWRHGREITKENPVLGIGYGTWLVYYKANYDPKGQLPHNIFIQNSAELGFSGFAVLLGLILMTFFLNHQTRALARRFGDRGILYERMGHGLDAALIGFMVSGFFVTVLYYPFMWINLAFTVSLNLVTKKFVATVTAPSQPCR